MTVLTVTPAGEGKVTISYPADHPMVTKIEKWLKNVSPGYTEYLIKSDGQDPHCNSCRDFECENQGNGDDACRAFKYGEEW